MEYFQIVLTLILGLYAILTAKKWNRLNNQKKTFVILSVVLALIVAYNAIVKLREDFLLAKISSLIGDIQNLKNAKAPWIMLGKDGAMVKGTNGVFGTPSDENLLGVYVIDHKFFLNAIVRNQHGKVIAAIEENQWKIFDGSDYEYNNDDDGFEIVSNGDHHVYFQVEMVNKIAVVNGLFVGGSGEGFYISGVKGGGTEFLPIDGTKENMVLPKVDLIFKYPRESFYGVRL